MAKRRAVVVCSACHKRKIKCDVQPLADHSTALRPCSACLERGTDCRLRSRKPYTSKVRNPKHIELERESQVLDDGHAPKTVSFSIDQAEITASVGSHPNFQTSSLYFGQSGYGSLFDIVHPPSHPQGRHLTIQSSRDSTLPAEDLAYLDAKGCFALPDNSHQLLEAYFKFVHPQFPVSDGETFLRNHADGRLETINLLLLWSMFSVSASYVPACQGAETKALYHARAKALFDISGENNKYILIQSSLLLSFLFDDVEDVKQSWYWTGIAFSLSHSLGLHDALQDSSTLSNTFLRDLWRCCIVRDAWLSYTMGRPLRLGGGAYNSLSECRFSDMAFFGERIHTDEEADTLGQTWRASVEAGLTLHMSLRAEPVRAEEVLPLWPKQPPPQTEKSSPAVTLGYRHLRLCQSATTIAVCQLEEKNGANGTRPPTDLIDTAEAEIASIVQSYLQDDTIGYVPLMIVPLLMPALLVSVGALKSSQADRRERAASNLSSYLELLGSIQHNYPAAAMVKRLFGTASQKILDGRHLAPD